jgi:hypothetical protein
MTTPLPSFTFLSDRSSFHKLVFVVLDNDWGKHEVELFVDLEHKQSQIVGINESKDDLFIPLELYDLDDGERDLLISEQYQDHIRGMFTMFIHSRVKKIFRFADEYNYLYFLKWIEGGLLRVY